MRSRTTHLIVFGALITALGQSSLASPAGKELDGTWLIESIVRDPREKAETEGKGLRVLVAGPNVVVKAAGEDKVLGKATIKITSTTKPKTIDLTGDGETDARLGIYELEGETLKLCWAPLEKKQRPTEFSATPGSQQTVITLKRKK